MIFEDQLAALEADSKRIGTQGQNIDFALLVDGLAAEREQGITIDVAYRFFATEKRKFIVADTPGPRAVHAQHGDRRVDRRPCRHPDRRAQGRAGADPPPQLSRAPDRHPQHRAGRQQDGPGRLRARRSSTRSSPTTRSLRAASASPISSPCRSAASRATTSPAASPNMPWYKGPALLPHLETVELDTTAMQDRPFRMAVQWVNRPNLDFRGFSGLISSGSVKPGDAIRVLPSGKTSTVTRVVTLDGDLEEAVAGQSVTVCFADEIDCSRGDVICARAAIRCRRPTSSKRRSSGWTRTRCCRAGRTG